MAINIFSEVSAKLDLSPYSLIDRVAVLIRSAIIAEKLRQNEMLVGSVMIDSVSEALGRDVSATIVRSACAQLETECLVTLFPNRGYMVRPVSNHEMTQAFQMRIALEKLAVRTSVPSISDASLSCAEKILESYIPAVDDELRRYDWNSRFHLALYDTPNSALFATFIQRLMPIGYRYTHMYYSRYARVSNGQDAFENDKAEHAELFSAYRAGDVKRAEKLIEDHLSSVYKLFSTNLF